MKQKILELKRQKNAIILAHYYTLPEVQEVADFVGDSLALAQQAATTSADIILFAGVHFMAETAKILNPTKKVLIPDFSAGCSLADSCEADKFAAFLKQYPDHKVLSYINCSAQVKTMSDIIVTSGNALKIVSALPEDEPIVFAPDRNLGGYINRTLGRKMVLWDGACHVHDNITAESVAATKEQFPDAKVLAHPECNATVLPLADFVGSTAAMLKFVKQDDCMSYIVVTEKGILYELQKQNPDKVFHVVKVGNDCGCSECEYMKRNNLENIFATLQNESPEMVLDEETILRAKSSIEQMLSF